MSLPTRTQTLQPAGEGAGMTSPVPSVSSVGLSLFLVLALIVALVWAARRLRPRALGGGELRVRSSLYLGPRERVVLIDAAGQHVLVSVCAGQVRHLHTYDRAPEVPQRAEPAPSLDNSFAARLRNSLGLEPRA